MDTQHMMQSKDIKQEPGCEGLQIKTEAIGEEESDLPTVKKRKLSGSDDNLMYCEKCQLKYEGDCPEHGFLVYIDNAETSQAEVCRENSNPQAADNKNRLVGLTIKEKAVKEEEGDMSHVVKRTSVEPTSLSLTNESSSLCCEKWQLKHEGVGCLENGSLANTGITEMSKDCSENSNLHSNQVKSADSKGIIMVKREKDFLSPVFEAHSDDVVTLPSGYCKTDSDKKYLISETNTELCTSDISCSVKEKSLNMEMNTELYTPGTSCGFEEIGHQTLTPKKTQTVEKPHKCEVCGAGFALRCYLTRHKKIHSGEKPYKCEVCGLGFTENRTLKDHRRAHTGEKPYKCAVCGVEFSQSGHLTSHMRIHTGEKPYKCDVCGVGFANNGNLKTHTRTHTGEKPYKCGVCSVGFAEHGNLKIHMRTHTGEKPYKCDVCSVKFSQSGHLKDHMRTHTGEKPYKCNVCGSAFAVSSALNDHKRIHTGEKPYKCEVCGVGFSEHCHLSRHKRTHTGEKPYVCEICYVGFAQHCHLKRHKKTHIVEISYNNDF